MQQTLEPNWWQSARFGGVIRYHWKSLGRTVAWVLLILLVSQVLSFLTPLVFDTDYTYTGAYADLGITMVVALICAVVAAHRSTRFLLRFGTSRLSVWLGNQLSLWGGMIAFLIGTLLLSILMGGLTMAMANTMPNRYVFQEFFGGLKGSEMFAQSLQSALASLPSYILYVVEWTSLFYLFGCCLRRNRGLTIFVIVGVPMLLMILTLIPAVRQAAQVVQNADEQQMMILGVQWMKYAADALKFIRNEWQTIQFIAAAVSLPLSYLCMRETPQP